MPTRGMSPFMVSVAPLSARGLTKRFARGLARSPRRTTAIDSIDIDVHAGELIGLVGGPGAGKTTLLQCLAGLLKPDAGRVQLFGDNLLPGCAPAGTVYVPAVPVYYPFLTPRDIVEVAMARNPVAERSASCVDNLLESLGIDAVGSARVGALPRDILKRVSIAAALAVKPAVILVDGGETDLVSGFHPAALRLLVSRVQEGAAAIVATRDASSVAFAATRLFLMNNGRAVRTFALESLGEPILSAATATIPRFVAERMH